VLAEIDNCSEISIFVVLRDADDPAHDRND
jgi:hypothetical protein